MECKDKNCYIHGALRVRGGRLNGIVVSDKAKRTVIVERSIIKIFSKYRRSARERSKIAAHIPECLSVKVGDTVNLGETRKISKTKAWTVLEVVKP